MTGGLNGQSKPKPTISLWNKVTVNMKGWWAEGFMMKKALICVSGACSPLGFLGCTWAKASSKTGRYTFQSDGRPFRPEPPHKRTDTHTHREITARVTHALQAQLSTFCFIMERLDGNLAASHAALYRHSLLLAMLLERHSKRECLHTYLLIISSFFFTPCYGASV